jgi:hypothetical protein
MYEWTLWADKNRALANKSCSGSNLGFHSGINNKSRFMC